MLSKLLKEYTINSCNDELLPKTSFIRKKKIFDSFIDKKNYHQEFELNKLAHNAEVKNYLEKSIKCNCGKPARLMVDNLFDVESKSWIDEPEKIIIRKFYSCKNRKCISKLEIALENSKANI